MSVMPSTETVTVLFSDVVGSTALLERLGPEKADRLRREHFLALRAAVSAHDGREIKNVGDGLMVVFGSAAAAVDCAVDMQRRASRVGTDDDVEPPALRVGIAAGDADIEDGDFFGRPVVEASRLCAAARGGQILVSELIRLLVGGRGGHELVPEGELALKGFDHPVLALSVGWSPEPPGAVGALDVPLPGLLALDARIPFVARSSEWDVLERAWAGAREGPCRAVLVGGDAGAGKTRLVSEFARAAHRRGGIVLFGACTEDVEVPYQPFVQALTHALENLTAELREELVTVGGAKLGNLLPSLVDAPGAWDPADHDGDTERYRLFEAVVGVLDDLGRRAPLLLVLDDVHWARRPTVQLLEHIVRSTRLGRVCVLATFRNVPADMGEALHEALPDLRRQPGVDRLTLAGFDAAGVRAFVEAVAGHHVDASLEPLVSHLMATTDGNAFLLGELWRHLVEVGCLVRLDELWSLAAPLSAAGSPEGVRELVGRRLESLPLATRELLGLAAVAGVEFELRVVAAAGEIDDMTAVDALEPAVEARLVDDTGGARFRFAHALVRDAAEDVLSPGRRRRHHLAVGGALERLGRGALDELAYHFTAAAPLAPAHIAVEYARRAAANAMQSLAYDNAVATLNSVLALADTADRIDVVLDLAFAHTCAANTAEGRQAAREAASLARRFGDRDRLVRAALIMSEATWRGMAFGAEMVGVLQEALAGENDPPTRARLLGGLSAAFALSGRVAESITAGDEAIAIARPLDDRRLLLEVMHNALMLDWRKDTIERLSRLTEEAVALARSSGDQDAELKLVAKLILGLLVVGDGPRVRRELARHDQLAGHLRQRLYVLVNTGFTCIAAMNDGRFADAELAADEFRRSSEALADAPEGYGVQMFGIRREQGRLGEMRPLLEFVTRSNQESSTWRPGLAVAYAEVGLLDAGTALIDQIVAHDLASIPRDSLWRGVLSFLADACALTGHTDAAQIVYRHLLEFRGLMVGMTGVTYYGSADRYLGKLAEICQQPREARAHFETALRLDEAAGWPVWVAHSRFALGRFLAEQGQARDGERARALLETALESADQFGMAALAQRCGKALESPRRLLSHSVRMTAREMTVLRLVAEGRTNQEIGAALHTSRHTVANQVRALFAKTGCSNRTEVAAWAHRRGLIVG
jgi:class 3 adenylate cyclase/DNA-binding CsgD family transcriptional regulator